MSPENYDDDIPDYDADEDHEAIVEPDWDGWEEELRAAARAFGVPPS